MHYYKDYLALSEPEKSAQAIADIKDYLGEEKFNQLNEAIQQEIKAGLTFKGLEFQLGMFIGIEGYPVQAWAQSLGLAIPDEVNHAD